LSERGRDLGLISEERWQAFSKKAQGIAQEQQRLKDTLVFPNSAAGVELGARLGKPLEREYKLIDLLKRPEANYQMLASIPGLTPDIIDNKVTEQVEIQAKYEGYILRQYAEIERQRRHEESSIPKSMNYLEVQSLSTEVQQKLSAVQPTTVGQASRIPGVTPAAISLLLVHLKKHKTAMDIA
jgi:tRNA uridine 5-carboxymethylaminomethyl modification enzyme